MNAAFLRHEALTALNGVGDPSVGEWEEMGEKAYHIRRRLTALEERRVGPVVDVRGTSEARRRLGVCSRWLPSNWDEPAPVAGEP